MTAQTPPTDPTRRTDPARRSARRLFSVTILVSEALVVLFAALVVHGLQLAPVGVTWAAAWVLVVLCLLAAGLLRGRGGYALGWAVQAALLAVSGAVPTMLVISVVFVLLWVVAQRLGSRVDRERGERERAALETADRVVE